MNTQASEGSSSSMARKEAAEADADAKSDAGDADGEELARFFRSYRINFSRAHTGRYVPSSKRKISWRFGLANLDALRSGCTGHECRGEENEVILIWSVRSGKTRLFWNNQDISHMVPVHKGHIPASRDLDKNTIIEPILRVEFTWESGSGHMMTVVAHVNAPPDGRQYELFIDGRPFSSLPKACQLGSKECMGRTLLSACSLSEKGFQMGGPSSKSVDADSCSSSRIGGSRNQRGQKRGEKASSNRQSTAKDSSDRRRRHSPPLNDSKGGDPLENSVYSRLSQDQRERLAAAGFVSQDSMVDELQSDYTTALKTLRDDLVVALPEVEDMMSFAIINAFSDGGDREEDMSISTWGDLSRASASSNLTGLVIEMPPTDAIGIEVDTLYEAFDWMKWKTSTKSQRRLEEQKRGLLQREVTQMVAHVRRGTLSALEASHIIQVVATLLGLKLASPLPRNTVLLTGLRKGTTKVHLRRALEDFGTIDGVAVASGGPGFGICRFRSTRAVRLAVDAAFRNAVDVDDVRPQIFEIQSPTFPTPVKLVTQEIGPSIFWDMEDGPDKKKKSEKEGNTPPDTAISSHGDNLVTELSESFDNSHSDPCESFDHNHSLQPCSSVECKEEGSPLSPLSAHLRKRSEFDSCSIAAMLDDESMAYSDDGLEVLENAIEVSSHHLVKKKSSAGSSGGTVSTAQSSLAASEDSTKRNLDDLLQQDADEASSGLTHILFTPETA